MPSVGLFQEVAERKRRACDRDFDQLKKELPNQTSLGVIDNTGHHGVIYTFKDAPGCKQLAAHFVVPDRVPVGWEDARRLPAKACDDLLWGLVPNRHTPKRLI